MSLKWPQVEYKIVKILYCLALPRFILETPIPFLAPSVYPKEETVAQNLNMRWVRTRVDGLTGRRLRPD